MRASVLSRFAIRTPSTISIRSIHAPRKRPKVVIAIGGSALLREKEEISQTNQLSNVKRAVAAIAKVCRTCDVVIVHGNGPQSGYLALRQGDDFDLAVVDAETQGMIGFMLEQELRNVLPETSTVAALLTQVEVDPKDPSFGAPTKPIGRFYNEAELGRLGPDANVVQVSPGKYRKVVASPLPKQIVEIETIKALLSMSTIVICGGGGGIPVARNPLTLEWEGKSAVIDKDRTAALIAKQLGADALCMLTDIDGVYREFKKPTQHMLAAIDAKSLSAAEEKALLAELPVGSMRPKVEAGLAFVRGSSASAYSVIGAPENLVTMLLDGTSGTRIVMGDTVEAPAVNLSVPHMAGEIVGWDKSQVENWLFHFVRLAPADVGNVLHIAPTGRALLQCDVASLMKAGLSWGPASALSREIQYLHQMRHGLVQLDSLPYRWPYNGLLHPNLTALLVIDCQNDFLSPEGYISSMGYDVSRMRSIIQPIQAVVKRFRELGFFVIHTREGHSPDLSDCPQNKHWRSRNLSSLGIGDHGPLGRLLVKGETGFQLIPELTPLETEVVIDKPGKGAFYSTSLDLVLRSSGVRNLILCGVTTDVSVHTTMREANDRGYECLLLTDCSAALDEQVHRAAVKSVQLSGGIFGATAESGELLSKLEHFQ